MVYFGRVPRNDPMANDSSVFSSRKGTAALKEELQFQHEFSSEVLTKLYMKSS